MQPTIESEKKRSPRFRVSKGIYAHIDSDKPIVGEVINISKGGLSLKYLPECNPSPKHSKLNLFALGGNFFLRNVSVRTVSDSELAVESEFSSIKMRRMGVSFKNLTDIQRQSLRDFMKNTIVN